MVLDDVLASKPKITEELNGVLNLELEVSIVGNTKHELVKGDMIIKADNNLFRIREPLKDFSSIRIFAKQVFWDLEDNFLEDARPENLNGAAALNWISSHTQYSHPFTFQSNISNTGTAYYVRKNPVEAIMSESNCFLNVWGGEMELDKFNVKINQVRGTDRGVAILYGKNLQEIEEDLNMATVVTRIMPIGYNENNQPVLLPEKYIDSPYINNYPHPKIKPYEFSNIRVDLENSVTLEMVYDMLRDEVQKLYDSGVDLPYCNYAIKFKELSKTEEYKNFAVLERVYLGDTVTIKHQKIGIDLKARLIKTIKEYNAALRIWEYVEIELGQFKPNYITESKKEISTIKQSIETQKSDLILAIENATGLITGNKGGYVVFRKNADGKPYEILIMDTEDINTAQNVWRWNQAGLGHSSNGYNGPYETAMTMDGSIVATMITTGILNAALIKTGFLKSLNELSWINMENGTFNFANKVTFDGANFIINGYVKVNDLSSGGSVEINGSNIVIGSITSSDGSIMINLDNGTFKFGSNASGDTAEHTPSYSKWTHSDGSYSQVSADGFLGYIGSTGRRYHNLIYTDIVYGTDLYNGTGHLYQLSDEFKGKDVAIITTAEASGDGYNEILFIGSSGQVESKVNGTIRLFGQVRTTTGIISPRVRFVVIA